MVIPSIISTLVFIFVLGLGLERGERGREERGVGVGKRGGLG